MARLRLPAVGQRAFDGVFGYVYMGLAVNVCLVAANAPLAFLLMFSRLSVASWPLLVVAAVTVLPSLAAAFAVFEAHGRGGTDPFAAFWRGWRHTLRRAGALGAGVGALALMIGADLEWTSTVVGGALLLPILLVVLALAVATAVTAVAALVTDPGAGLVAVLKASLVVGVRLAPLTLVTLALVAVCTGVLLAQPILGALLAMSPLLYLVFSNSRFLASRAGLVPSRVDETA